MKFFERLKQSLTNTRKKIAEKFSNVDVDERIDDNFFNDLEEVLIMADVGVDTSSEMVSDLQKTIKQKKIKLKSEAQKEMIEIAKNMFKIEEGVNKNLIYEEDSDNLKPKVILILGVNGVGKTTTIAKLATFLKNRGKEVVLAAGDTFRAAAVEQLQIWADRVGCRLISHGQDCDPAAVIFDAISFAKNHRADYVICDTAGRLHNKKNLMMQLQKVIKVAQKEAGGVVESLLVIDSTMGQNSLNQVEEFQKIADLNGIVLTKLDGTAKGGIALAIVHEKKVAIRFLGLGEGADDLQEFEVDSFVDAIFG